MQITKLDEETGVRQPTISKNTSAGREFFRSATWQDGDTTTTVTAIAFVSGIRARRNADGSRDFLGEFTRFEVLGRDEFVQYVERAAFLWDRERSGVTEHAMDYSNEIGLFYQDSVTAAEEQCRIFMDSLDFNQHFDPAAWK